MKKAEANEPLELVKLHPDCPNTMTRLGTKLVLEYQEALRRLLIKHRDVFVWSHEEMLVIDNEVTEHRLCVDPTVRKIQQKMRTFNTEKCATIAEEIDCLLAVGFIKKNYYP